MSIYIIVDDTDIGIEYSPKVQNNLTGTGIPEDASGSQNVTASGWVSSTGELSHYLSKYHHMDLCVFLSEYVRS